ncbi:hypothetical protein SAMN04489796_1176 [Winogradskyella thalassocola]|uniref:Uncharacterized protein n=1 Tax=Winogradskyella thalassocola TaxID=262004 RepID=A0A1G8M5S9_9FLAO|nr:hypothetical protein SAMN04489796_1176 [Winogradskyella thalassocola]
MMKFLQGFGFSILFILLGLYILNTNDSTLGKIIGTACIVFFSGLILWAIFKKIKQSKD